MYELSPFFKGYYFKIKKVCPKRRILVWFFECTLF